MMPRKAPGSPGVSETRLTLGDYERKIFNKQLEVMQRGSKFASYNNGLAAVGNTAKWGLLLGGGGVLAYLGLKVWAAAKGLDEVVTGGLSNAWDWMTAVTTVIDPETGQEVKVPKKTTHAVYDPVTGAVVGTKETTNPLSNTILAPVGFLFQSGMDLGADSLAWIAQTKRKEDQREFREEVQAGLQWNPSLTGEAMREQLRNWSIYLAQQGDADTEGWGGYEDR